MQDTIWLDVIRSYNIVLILFLYMTIDGLICHLNNAQSAGRYNILFSLSLSFQISSLNNWFFWLALREPYKVQIIHIYWNYCKLSFRFLDKNAWANWIIHIYFFLTNIHSNNYTTCIWIALIHIKIFVVWLNTCFKVLD